MNLTKTEKQVLVAALEFYRIKKSAEGKLKEHATLKTSEEGAKQVAQQYARLNEVIADLKKRIGE